MADQKVAILTAAGSGIGAACARALANDGWHVAVQSSSGKGEALGKELGGIGLTGSYLEASALEELVTAAMDKWGRIDGVLNGAGHGPKGPVLEISDEDWVKGMEYYMLPVVRMARLVTPIMEKQGGGTILNVSTYAAFEPEALFPTSGVFRASLAAYTKLFTDKYAAANIRMNNILPGFIDSLPEAEERRARIPMGRYGTAEEVGKTAAFLMSDAAGYITGQNIRVDGGITRSV